MENWVLIQDYPRYSVSDLGRIRNDRTERTLSIVRGRTGHPYVGMMTPEGQVKRSVPRLVCGAFLPNPKPYFDTPIHFDGDLSNCRLVNLDWRPRWFAMRYAAQFRKSQPNHPRIRNKRTGEEFEDCWSLVKQYGLLYNDIIVATTNGSYVFPTTQTFEWVLRK